MKKLLFLSLAAFTLGLGLQAEAAESADQPKVIAAKFHKDTCGTCKKLAPEMAQVMETYDDKAILFVTFDRTSEGTSHQAELLASSLGIADVYKANPGAGYVVLIDATTKKPLGDKLKGMNADQIGEKIAANLK